MNIRKILKLAARFKLAQEQQEIWRVRVQPHRFPLAGPPKGRPVRTPDHLNYPDNFYFDSFNEAMSWLNEHDAEWMTGPGNQATSAPPPTEDSDQWALGWVTVDGMRRWMNLVKEDRSFYSMPDLTPEGEKVYNVIKYLWHYLANMGTDLWADLSNFGDYGSEGDRWWKWHFLAANRLAKDLKNKDYKALYNTITSKGRMAPGDAMEHIFGEDGRPMSFEEFAVGWDDVLEHGHEDIFNPPAGWNPKRLMEEFAEIQRDQDEWETEEDSSRWEEEYWAMERADQRREGEMRGWYDDEEDEDEE